MWYKKILENTVNIVFSLVEVFLLMRFVLKLFGANTSAPFVSWIYETSDPLLYPFRGMFSAPVLEDGLIIEFSTLFAVIVYAIVAWILIEIINYLSNFRKAKNNEEGNDRLE
ncbi:MAG: YggT family protein [Parcubacteria group bacterium]